MTELTPEKKAAIRKFANRGRCLSHDYTIALLDALEAAEAKAVGGGELNVCEHGDHPAPIGARFCSVSCEQCEYAGDEGCSGLCAFSQLDAERELVEAAVAWREYDETHDPKSPGWTTAPFCRWLMAVNKVIALRKASR